MGTDHLSTAKQILDDPDQPTGLAVVHLLADIAESLRVIAEQGPR